MKKKAKRYQEGGEAEEKRRGLKASEGEKVGFLERLRMGNIDDPTSEAYKRLGAGRGRATASPDMTPYSETEDAKNLMRAATRETQGARAMADTDVSGMDRYASEMGRGQMRAAPAPVRRTPRAAPATMAGDDELERDAAATAARMRDERTQYMQDQDAKAAARTAQSMMKEKASGATPKTATAPTGRFTNTGYSEYERIRQEGKERRAAAKESEPKKESTSSRRGQRGPKTEVPARPSRAFSTPASRKAWDEKYGDKYDSSGNRKPGMKAGGMVKSGASKRADGIATKGKTRGRII
jgi:hypothetical protein